MTVQREMYPVGFGCFRFPDTITLVLHDEAPRRDRGYVNGRCGSAEVRMDAARLEVQLERDALVSHCTGWFGERLWQVVTLDRQLDLRAGQRLAFTPDSPILIAGGALL